MNQLLAAANEANSQDISWSGVAALAVMLLFFFACLYLMLRD